MLLKALLFLASIVYVRTQFIASSPQYGISNSNPYQYSYTTPVIGGASSLPESGAVAGQATGSTTLLDVTGPGRSVERWAADHGFGVTNEITTSNQAQPPVGFQSSAVVGSGGTYALVYQPVTYSVYGGSNSRATNY